MSQLARFIVVAALFASNEVQAQGLPPLKNGFGSTHTRPTTPFIQPPPPAPTAMFSLAPAPKPILPPPYMKIVTHLPAGAYVKAPIVWPPALTTGAQFGLPGQTFPNPFPPQFPPNWDYSLNNPYRFWYSGMYANQLLQWVQDYNRYTRWNAIYPLSPYPGYDNPYSNPYTYSPAYNPYSAPYVANPYMNPTPMGISGGQPAPSPMNNAAYPQQAAQMPAPGGQQGVANELPLAMRLLPESERAALDRLGVTMEILGKQSATGTVNPNLQKSALNSIAQVRRWLQAHDTDMGEQTYLDGMNFLRRVEANLKY